MTEQFITSRQNPALQRVRRLLTSRRERESEGCFVADGTKLLAEAARFADLETVILTEGTQTGALAPDVRIIRVPAAVMASLSPMETPQGALFVCRMPKKTAFVPQPGMLLLDGIQDPGNIGTILRTADALNIPVALLEGCADPYSWKTVRASMGASFRTPAVQVGWAQALDSLHDAGIPLAVTALSETAVDIRTADLKKLAVVIGSEGRGVRRELLEAADTRLIIPMNPHCESLNAAIAAAIVMWQEKQNEF